MFYPKTHTVISLKVIFSKNSNFALNYANLLKKYAKRLKMTHSGIMKTIAFPKVWGLKKFLFIFGIMCS